MGFVVWGPEPLSMKAGVGNDIRLDLVVIPNMRRFPINESLLQSLILNKLAGFMTR